MKNPSEVIIMCNIRAFITSLVLSLTLLASSVHATQGGQYQQSGRYQIHYMALTSTFLTPAVAKTYDIKRSRYNAFINISILDTLIDNNPAVKAKVVGQAINLTGSIRKLTFREIIEGDAIYYIAQLPFRNDERFTIHISSSNGDGLNSKISFKQEFYAQ